MMKNIEKEIININNKDKFDFDISPQKQNDSLKQNNLNNIDLIVNINIEPIKFDCSKNEEMVERPEDNKRSTIMDRIIKGRDGLNENNKSKNESMNIK